MRPSEMALLRKELAKVVAENRNLQKKISEIEGTLTKKNILLELEIDRLRLELAKLQEDGDVRKLRRLFIRGLAVQRRTRRFPKEDGEGGCAGGRT